MRGGMAGRTSPTSCGRARGPPHLGHHGAHSGVDQPRRRGDHKARTTQSYWGTDSKFVTWWHDRFMTAVLPRTIRAVDTERLLWLEEEAARLGFSQRLPVDWLR